MVRIRAWMLADVFYPLLLILKNKKNKFCLCHYVFLLFVPRKHPMVLNLNCLENSTNLIF